MMERSPRGPPNEGAEVRGGSSGETYEAPQEELSSFYCFGTSAIYFILSMVFYFYVYYQDFFVCHQQPPPILGLLRMPSVAWFYKGTSSYAISCNVHSISSSFVFVLVCFFFVGCFLFILMCLFFHSFCLKRKEKAGERAEYSDPNRATPRPPVMKYKNWCKKRIKA